MSVSVNFHLLVINYLQDRYGEKCIEFDVYNQINDNLGEAERLFQTLPDYRGD